MSASLEIPSHGTASGTRSSVRVLLYFHLALLILKKTPKITILIEIPQKLAGFFRSKIQNLFAESRMGIAQKKSKLDDPFLAPPTPSLP